MHTFLIKTIKIYVTWGTSPENIISKTSSYYQKGVESFDIFTFCVKSSLIFEMENAKTKLFIIKHCVCIKNKRGGEEKENRNMRWWGVHKVWGGRDIIEEEKTFSLSAFTSFSQFLSHSFSPCENVNVFKINKELSSMVHTPLMNQHDFAHRKVRRKSFFLFSPLCMLSAQRKTSSYFTHIYTSSEWDVLIKY